MNTASKGPLDGIVVMDFGRYVAGPWCGFLLGALGAEVIRVERPGGAEDRALFPLADGATGAFMAHANRGKRSITVHPGRPGGREVIAALVGAADVVVANLPDAGLAALGLDWATVHAVNPKVVLATATTFDTSGPYGDRLGFDGIGQAMSGAMFLSGHAGEPMKAAVPWVDYMTATILAMGVCAALRERELTGQGRHVAGDLLGTAVAATGHFLAEEATRHPDRHGTGNRHPLAGPSDAIATRDGHILVQVIGGPMFARWCNVVGRPDLIDDDRFATDELRGRHGEVLSEVMGQWCSQRNTAEVLETLAAAEVPAGPVLSAAGALADPQIVATLLGSVSVPDLADPVTVAHAPWRLDGRRPDAGGRLADLGADTEAVLSRLGFDADRIEHLRAAGAIG